MIVMMLALDLYAFQAIRYLAQSWTPLTRNIVYGIYWLMPVLALLLMLPVTQVETMGWSKPVLTMLRAIVFISYFSKFLMVVVLLIDDLRRLFSGAYQYFSSTVPVDYSRSRFMSTSAVLLGSLPFLTLSYGIFRNPYRYKVFKTKLPIDGLPEVLEGLKIVQISDIHSGSFTFKEPVRNAIRMINEQEPDLVFFTGDMVNNRASEMEPFLDVFNGIKSRHGVFSVLGNHDYGDYVPWLTPEDKVANLDTLKSMQRSMGWDLLVNEHRMLDIRGERVAVIGVENYSTQMRFPKYGDLKRAVSGIGDARLRLLLSHDPSHWESQVITEHQDIDITFSGHTHGMQFGVEIPGWIKWSPVQYVYKQWAGLYKHGRQYLYVNRGLGFLGYPGRVGILPEITVLELTGRS